ncbi:Dps family protein [Tropicimonas isoalkanivorans]|uniref:Starvation-inducible DNA-binding protein n=1 Tax=Tropicimonas isoalkanivorans TaxID=441112 RepID=A0A1I1P7I6_9RHOB|nr:DNA starvation/stationary phase protection protein [Tropicimonas isoalkanivorans]SFD03618.1 starvation-inducible DNA-binding protein [Tropicimonas isoalkanivorans]
MSEPLKVVPSSTKVDTGVEDTGAVASALADILSDTYALVLKTHAYHWNVEGPLFYALHHLTEEQYNNLFAATDVLAERIRALGHLAPMKMADIVETSVIKDAEGTPSAGEMATDLANDHERVASRLRDLVGLAEEKNNDPVTADLAIARAAFHEKAAWMLRSLAAT